MNKIKLAVVDDHTILRESLVSSLEEEKDFEIVGHWSNAEDLLAFLDENTVDIAILDNKLPGITGIETARIIKNTRPEIATIILTMYNCEKEILQAFYYGANGYMPKDNSIGELIAAIHCVYAGCSVVGSGLMPIMMKYNEHLFPEEPAPSVLNEEERIIIRMAAGGCANKEIAEELGLSLGLIKFRFREILKKLEVKDRTQAVVKAMKMGILEV